MHLSPLLLSFHGILSFFGKALVIVLVLAVAALVMKLIEAFFDGTL